MSVITDRVTRVKPTLPTLGAAGSSYIDAAFGTTITRITDATTPAGGDDDTGISLRTPASTETRGWSCDSSAFFLMSTFGTAEAFNATTHARIRTLAFSNEPTFSSATPNLLWGPDTTVHPQICRITTAGTKTVGLDLTDLVPSLLSGPRTYLGQVLTASDPEILAVNFGGTAQDLHYLCLVADVADLAGGRILDTLASTIDGVAIGTTLGFYLHSIGLDQSGRYVLLYPVAQDPPIVVWDTQTDTFTTLTFADDAPGGHGALGFGVYANQDATGTYDGLQYQLRSLATPHTSTDLQVPLLSPVEIYLGTHPNWNNAQPDHDAPIIVGTYREAAGLDEGTYPWRAWDDEIISVATDGSFVISRYCHHRSDLSIISDDWGVFWFTPRPQVSPDGTKILFTSNFAGTLGDDASEPGTPRQDVFLVLADNRTLKIFDTFDGLRPGPGGGELWDVYTGNGSQQTVMHAPPGPFSWRIDGPSGDGQDSYVHFFPRGVSGYFHPDNYFKTFARDPAAASTVWADVNRAIFRIKSDTAFTTGSVAFTHNVSPYLSANFGSYIRPLAHADHGSAGQHYYQGVSFNIGSEKWYTVYLNRTPNHRVGCNANLNWRDDPQFANVDGDPDVVNGFAAAHWYEAMTRLYMSMFAADQSSEVLTGSTWTIGRVDYDTVAGEPDAEIYTIVVGYNGARYEAYWNGIKGTGRTYELRYKATSMKSAGFTSGTDGGTTTNPGDAYTACGWASPNMAEAAGGLYLAIRVSGAVPFTEVYIGRSDDVDGGGTIAGPSPTSVSAVVTVADKAYDGTTAATILTRDLTGVAGGDDVTLAGGTATFADSAVGVAKTVTIAGLTLSGADAADYVLSASPVTTTADILAVGEEGGGMLQTHADTFVQRDGIGTQTITGCGFTPKAVLFFSTGNVTFSGPLAFRLGFDDGTTHVGKACNSGDFLGAYDESETAASDSYSLVTVRNSAFNNINALGYVSAFTSDGYIVTWDQNSNGWSNGQVWNYLAIGGSGVSAKVGKLNIPGSPSTVAIAGLTFAPTVLFTSFHPIVQSSTVSGPGMTGTLGLGVATSCGPAQWGISGDVDAVANPSNTASLQQSLRAFSVASASAEIIAGAVSAWNSDGASVAFATVTSNFYFAYLAIGGVSANIGTFTQPIATGMQSVAFAAASPKALLVAGTNKVASGSITANASISIGALSIDDISKQNAIWTADLDNVAPPGSAHFGTTLGILMRSLVPTGYFTSSLTASAPAVTFTQGLLTLDWTVVDSTARSWLYVVLGDDLGTGACGVSPPTPVGTARTIRRLRRFPLYYADNQWIYCSRFELVIQQGIGLSSGQGVAPIVMFRYSTDGGFTWGNEIQMTAGPIGATRWRTYVNMLPRARQPVVEITTSDPVFWAIVGASAEITVGTS